MDNIKITTFVLGLMRTNTYLVENMQDRTCFVVDPATESDKLISYIDERNLDVKCVLITHGHFDHIGGARLLQEKYGAKIYMHKSDVDFIDNPLDFGRKFPRFDVDVVLEGNEVIEICGKNIEVIHTPGHSLGGVCYVLEDVIFCGDTIFKDGFGRYDLRGGDIAQLQNSISKLFETEGDKILLCGHGPSTTLAGERANSSVY